MSGSILDSMIEKELGIKVKEKPSFKLKNNFTESVDTKQNNFSIKDKVRFLFALAEDATMSDTDTAIFNEIIENIESLKR